MLSALNIFGLAIGCMDIIGALFFELMIIYMLRQRGGHISRAAESSSEQQAKHGPSHVAMVHGNRVSPLMLWSYLLLLNVWIIVSLLMVVGIILHKPQLLLFWLVLCLGGLILDLVCLVHWFLELLSGDVIDSLTNILITLLNMAIEMTFVCVIYRIYFNLTHLATRGLAAGQNIILRFSQLLF